MLRLVQTQSLVAPAASSGVPRHSVDQGILSDQALSSARAGGGSTSHGEG
jgi:hypothetical protein